LDLTSLGFTFKKSSTGPSSVQIAHNGTGTFNTYSPVFTPTTSDVTTSFSFTSFSSSPGGSVTFRIYGWGATGFSGTMSFTNVSVNGSVSPSSPFTFDYINGGVGIGVTPITKLHIDNGNNKGGILIKNNNGNNWLSDTINGYNYLRGVTILADSGGRVGIGTSTFVNSNQILQIGKDHDTTAKSAIYIGSYVASGTPLAQFSGNWASPGRWGIGPSSAQLNDNTKSEK